MSTSVATATTTTTTTTKPKPLRGEGRGNRTFGGRRGGGRKSQNDTVPTESVDAVDTSATPAATTPTVANPDTVAKSAGTASQDEDTGMCWICREPVKYYSISECNHRTCHVCALRLRALYKRQDCTFCKVRLSCTYGNKLLRISSSRQEPQSSLIFTTSPTATFKSFGPGDIPYKDNKLSVFFETQEMMEDTLILLRFNCPDGSCDYIASGWNDLRLHVRGSHGNLMWYGCFLSLRSN